MSNENNEEIELFDYMDEESESRKIPVNKKKKQAGKVADQRKRKKPEHLHGLEELRQQ